jgi:tRNA A-37 threonylcarbamoyl transferase component Bud32
MRFVQINPRYSGQLAALELRTPEQFLALPAIIVSGHPDRHVGRVTLGDGASSLVAFLKREHRVRWRDRLASAWAGYGWIAKSQREARILQALAEAHIDCPEWIACGEDGKGRAFMLVRALTDAVDLRRLLQDVPVGERAAFARRLGAALARVHAAGVDHPDLYSKHVFVSPKGERIYLLDWQRSRRGKVRMRQRCRDLAALDATLAEHLASAQDRAICLGAYLKASSLGADIARFARSIRRQSLCLLKKRHVREARLARPSVSQELIWVNGEALCATPEFVASWKGTTPDWLRLEHIAWSKQEPMEARVELPDGRQGLLVRRRETRPFRWLWTELCRKAHISPEVRQAGVIFRRRRAGLPAPRLLAFGERHPMPWQTESFLLTEYHDGRCA